MTPKDCFQDYHPIKLYIIIVLTVIFFIVEFIFSHISHALTLLMDSYHTFCNILALTGYMIAIKYERKPTSEKLKNTFGWARISVVSLFINCIFISSFSFGVIIEAFQILVNIRYSDEMHHSLCVFIIGIVGLILNGICYLLIGGYTYHQGSSNKILIPELIQQQRNKQLSANCKEMFRDILGNILTIFCALMVYSSEKNTAKYVDPIMAIISAVLLMVLSYPYLKENGLIVLQTMPASINIDSLKKDLLKNFPEIINIHDFHVWQLTASKVVSTIHIIFNNEEGYEEILTNLKLFFSENGIFQVTIQPEFLQDQSVNTSLCLMQCQGENCKLNHCCPHLEINII